MSLKVFGLKTWEDIYKTEVLWYNLITIRGSGYNENVNCRNYKFTRQVI